MLQPTFADVPFPLLALFSGTSWLNTPTYWLLFVVVILLAVASLVGQSLKRQPATNVNAAVLRNFNLRVQAWWMMCAILAFGFLLGPTCTILLFFGVSFWALREFITMTPTRRGDHRTLFWVFFMFTPIQYVLVGLGRDPFGWGRDLYGLYSIMIPVYGSLFIPARIAISGDFKRFLERSAKIQAGLLICVYSLSYAPALLHLELATWKPAPITSPQTAQQAMDPAEELQPVPAESVRGAAPEPVLTTRRLWSEGSRAGLLFYFILVVQAGDVFQFIWGKVLGRRVIAPQINASRTWEGFFGGVATTTLFGALLWWVTPFRIWEAACMSMITAVMGFAGSITMSAVKRDRGVRDTGTLVQGHAGVLDRIDSICFSAPVFFHLTRYFFSDIS